MLSGTLSSFKLNLTPQAHTVYTRSNVWGVALRVRKTISMGVEIIGLFSCIVIKMIHGIFSRIKQTWTEEKSS